MATKEEQIKRKVRSKSLAELKSKVKARLSESTERTPPVPSPRYDMIFVNGQRWLDDLACGSVSKSSKELTMEIEMNIRDIDRKKMEAGEYCQKGVSGCFCAVGFPYEYMCEDCRDGREISDKYSYCVCGPDGEE
jgi:hypothetical protein